MQKEARAINDELFVEALAAFKRYCGTTNKEATNMQMSEEMALRLHRMMWSDMQSELGDNPSDNVRIKFKYEWVKRNFPGESIANDCWLCEYALSKVSRSGVYLYCKYCPIRWPGDTCCPPEGGVHYETSPISDILALPARNVANDYEHVAYSYYKSREILLSNASGIPASSAIEDHVAEIRKKEDRSVMQVLEIFSGLKGEGCWVIDHVKKIQEKAIEEYFKERPGAKLASMDVDDAFRQYAKEQMEPLRKASMLLADQVNKYKDKLSEQSGLDHDKPIDDHIREIVKNSMEAGAAEERDRIQEKIYEVLLS